MVDGNVFKSSEHDSRVHFTLASARNWTLRVPYGDMYSQSSLNMQHAKLESSTHLSGRIQTILTSPMPIQIIIPQRSPSRERSAALRLAHILNVYHKLDVDIVDGDEALSNIHDGTFTPGNVIAIGDTRAPLIQHLLAEKRTPFLIDDTSLSVNGRPLTQAGLGSCAAVCYILLLTLF